MLKRATGAKEATERAEIEEALKLAYIDLVGEDVLNHKNEVTLGAAVQKVKQQGYDDKIATVSGGSTSYKLSSSSIILGSSAPNNTAQITVEKDTTADSGSKYYAVITGKYYEIKDNNNGDIKIATTASDVDLSGSGSSSSAISLQDSNVTFGTANVATATASGSTITLTASGTGKSTITVNVNGKTVTGNVEVVGSIVNLTNVAGYKLDGAMVPRDTTAGTGKTVSSNDESIAQVTTEGIVKCGTKKGTTTVKIDDKVYKVTSSARIVQAGANKTLDGGTTGTANNPIIPTGFSAINTKDAQWKDDNGNNVVASNVNNGLVIMDEKGNQFVWVPVADINSMVMCKNNNIDGHTCNIQLNGDTLSCTATGHSDELCGKLYATSTDESFDSTLTIQTYTQNSGLREPDVLTDTIYGDWSTNSSRGFALLKQYVTGIAKDGENNDRTNDQIKAIWEKQLKDEFLEMAKSVAKNKGFYIGRYEASLINNSTRVVAGSASMSAETISAGTWYGLYQKQKDFISNSSIKSTMIWGSQYDAMMNWFGETTAKGTIGNNRNRDSSTWKTGTVATDKIKNVFDLYGLRREWTLEARSMRNRVIRGGDFDKDSSPSNRNDFTPDVASDSFGSRPTLYVQ